MNKSNVTKTTNCKPRGFTNLQTIQEARNARNRLCSLLRTMKFRIVKEGGVFNVIKIG